MVTIHTGVYQGRVFGGVEGLEQSTQLADIGGRTLAIQTEIGHDSLGTAFGRVLDQSLKFIQRHGYPAVSDGRYVHYGLQKQETPHAGGVNGIKGIIETARICLKFARSNKLRD